MIRAKHLLPTFVLACSVPLCLIGQEVEVTSQEVVPGIYMLRGMGGNIGLLTGPDATFMIDDDFAMLTDKIVAAVAELSERPVDFVVNTHWHGDHTGGNENLGRAGALIVAHEHVRESMSEDQFIELFNMSQPAAPPVALPVVTFADAVTLHLNGQTIRVRHFGEAAHTRGDAVVIFEEANVVHMGDIFFNGTFPFVDVDHGGSVAGVIRFADRVLELSDEETKIIPGHGELTDRAGLKAYRDMLVGVRQAVGELVAAGHERDAVIAAKPTAPWDAVWGGGAIGPDVFTGIAFDSARAENE